MKCHSCGKHEGEYQWMTKQDKIVLVCRVCWNILHQQLHKCGASCPIRIRVYNDGGLGA